MREFLDGNTAVVRGALAAGCDFFAGYPITPASPILMQMMTEQPKRGGVAIQAEDEIASIGMCIGATMSGSRAMTATSGPGISLYSENIGLAIMTEAPLVIVDVQRMGPCTGAATTTGQGDVQFVRWGTAGGYPIIALAPSNIRECYELTMRAFSLAERFRTPVFVLIDKSLGATTVGVDVHEFVHHVVADRKLWRSSAQTTSRDFRPHSYEPRDAVPVMARYGDEATLRVTGSTHDERAFITKDRTTIDGLNNHLADKIEKHRDEIELVVEDLEEGADTLFLSYGVTAGSMRESVITARRQGRKVSALCILSLWPLPETALARAFKGIERIVVAELNLGLYRREIERLARHIEVVGLTRLDGGLITPSQFLELLK